MADQIETVLEDLECPVCLDIFKPPIKQCDQGHSVCGDCMPRIETCPICRSYLTDLRNFTLEKVIEHVKLSCKYRKLGCTHISEPNAMKAHVEFDCEYKPFKCIYCQNETPADKFDEHYAQCDTEAVSVSHSPDLRYVLSRREKATIYSGPHPFLISQQKTSTVIIKMESDFIFVVRYLRKDNMWYIWVAMVSSVKSAGNYMFLVELRRNEHFVSYSGPVHSFHKNEDEIMLKGHCVNVSHSLITEMKDDNDMCQVKVTITTK